MQAKDLMTAEVVSVSADTPVAEIAGLLLKHRIGAVPVVDSAGAPIGMVSDGDLLGRTETERLARGDWWLKLLAESETLHPDFMAGIRKPDSVASDRMSKPVITVEETTEAREIARLLGAHRVKRMPVIRDGRMVGIVSRADVVRAMAAEAAAAAPKPGGLAYLTGIISELDQRFLHSRDADNDPKLPAETADAGPPTAADFDALIANFFHARTEHRQEAREAIAESRHQQVRELIDHHIVDSEWKAILQGAREAAEHGEKQFLLLRFPCDLCSDGGRAINAPLANWPETLRGEAAEIYLRWESDLKPHGFHLAARVLDFPGGFPGDIGLSLTWTE